MDKILQDLLSGDAQKIWSGAGAVSQCHDRGVLLALSDHIESIKSATNGIELGGMLHPNSEHLRRAIERLVFVREEKGCLCGLYATFDDPSREAEAGRVRILETVLLDGGPYVDHYQVECNSCKQNWKVVEREYHYTWFGWERM